MTIATLLLLGALVLFILGALGVSARVNWTDAGLACLVLAMLVGGAVAL